MLGRQDYPWYGITLQKNKTFEEDNVVTTLLLSLDFYCCTGPGHCSNMEKNTMQRKKCGRVVVHCRAVMCSEVQCKVN
jgi:hypothetical protein